MPNYRRYFVPGGAYFFTLVAHERRPIFTTPTARRCLRKALLRIKARRPFEILAIVLLPDHLHTVWTLPHGDSAYPRRWARVKESFTRDFLKSGGKEGSLNRSRVMKRERGVWRRRYWEHTVDDEGDLESCINYIHWNPVKHALVERVSDYPWSTFHRYVREGHYEPDWGRTNPCPNFGDERWE